MNPPSSPQAALGAAIKALREKKEMKQQTLAEAAGIGVAHLSKIEHGRGNPTWSTVVSIADALDLSVVEVARRFEKLR